MYAFHIISYVFPGRQPGDTICEIEYFYELHNEDFLQ